MYWKDCQKHHQARVYLKNLKPYKYALKDSGFTNDLRYLENNSNANDSKRKRKRKILWFNPPLSKRVNAKIVKILLQILWKHFPKNHKTNKVFYRNTVKISCSCMKNIGSIISILNWNILNPIVQSDSC